MNHNAHKHKENSSKDTSSNRLLITIFLNLIITIGEFVGGIISGSLALMSDALHNAGDTFSIALSFIAKKVAGREATNQKTFGYKRIEILSALFNATTLLAIAIFLISEAIERIQEPKAIESGIMLWVAVIGLVANLIGAVLLHQHSHSSLNIKSAYLHLIGDTISSIAVIVGAILIQWLGIIWIDPTITIVVSIYLIIESWKIIKQSTNILMQAAPDEIQIDHIRSYIEKYTQIRDIHHIHLWNLDDKTIFLEAHLLFNDDLPLSSVDKIRNQIELELKANFGINHLTLQSECLTCSNPALSDDNHVH